MSADPSTRYATQAITTGVDRAFLADVRSPGSGSGFAIDSW